MENRNIGGMVDIQEGIGEEKYNTIPGYSCSSFFSGIGGNKEGIGSHITGAGQLRRIGFM